MARLAPQSNFARYTAARSALFVKRMEEAKRGLLSVDINSPELGGVDRGYSDLCDVLHAVGEYDQQLALGREWGGHPGVQQPERAVGCQATALAALGRTTEIGDRLARLLDPGPAGQSASIAQALRAVAELRWHGHDSTAQRLSRAALERPGAFLSVADQLTLLVYAGELERASAQADSVVRADPVNVMGLGWLGALAASRKDSAIASHALGRLERLVIPYDGGTIAHTRAGILAHLGRPDDAVQLLRQAFAEGTSFQPASYHARFGLEPLRGFAPFEAFVKPR
jgi:tetratricopeptide (TPR) repeat protein